MSTKVNLIINNNLKNYARVIRSDLLIITKAIPIASTTRPPATKLDKKFPNEGVIYKIPFYFDNNKVKNSNIDYNIYCINFSKKIALILLFKNIN